MTEEYIYRQLSLIFQDMPQVEQDSPHGQELQDLMSDIWDNLTEEQQKEMHNTLAKDRLAL